MKNPATYFLNLDGVRAFACLTVFIAHTFDYINNRHLGTLEAGLYSHFIRGAGSMGVSLFFVLSGFLITSLLLEEKKRFSTISLRFFYMKRILRIWPLFFAVTIAGFFIVPLMTHDFSITTVKQHLPWFLTFTNNFDRIMTDFTGMGSDNLGVLWSVAVEEQFYLLWPLLMLLSGPRTFTTASVTLIAGSCIFRYFHAGDVNTIYFHSMSVAGDLAIGGIVACLGAYWIKFKPAFSDMKQVIRIPIYLVIAAIVLFHNQLLSADTNVVSGRLLLGIAFGVLIADQSYSSDKLFAISRFKLLGKMGAISYGFYCFHMFAIMLFQKLNAVYFPGKISTGLFYAELIGAFFLTLIISIISHRYFEKFFMNLRSRFTPSYQN